VDRRLAHTLSPQTNGRRKGFLPVDLLLIKVGATNLTLGGCNE
jgi:hypothetical protein